MWWYELRLALGIVAMFIISPPMWRSKFGLLLGAIVGIVAMFIISPPWYFVIPGILITVVFGVIIGILMDVGEMIEGWFVGT